MRRIADLVRDRIAASPAPAPWSRRSSTAASSGPAAMRRFQRMHQLLHVGLGVWAGSSASPSPAPRPRPAPGRSDACSASSAAAPPSGPAASAEKKSKFSSSNGFESERSRFMQRMPAQIALDRLQRLGGQLLRSPSSRYPGLITLTSSPAACRCRSGRPSSHSPGLSSCSSATVIM